MQGIDEGSQIGIVPRAVHMIFDHLEKRQKFGNQTFSVTMSCYEIYIETVRDLFDPQNSQNQATNLSKWKAMELEVTSMDDVQHLLEKVVKNRK